VRVLDTALGCASALPHLLWTLTHARTARRPAYSTPATARGATSRPGVLCISTVRSKPWRAGVRPARIQAHDHLQNRVLGSKAGSTQHETRHRGGSPRHSAAASGFPEHRAGRLPHKHRQRRIGTARSWRWGAPAPPPRSPCCTNQNGTTAKTWNLRRDARSAQGSTARRGDVLSSPSKAARAPAFTCSPGARGLG
jgi:hypothetical protein